MPYPVLHSYAGYSLYKASRKPGEDWYWSLAFLYILLANLADFDFLIGSLLKDDPQLFHRGVSHSLGASLICGLIAGVVMAIWKQRSFLKSFLIAATAYFSHIVMDYLWGHGAEASMPVFWPFSAKKFISPFLHLGEVGHAAHPATFLEFIRSLLEPVSIHRSMLEILIVLFVELALMTLREIRVRGVRETAHISFTLILFAVWIVGFVNG